MASITPPFTFETATSKVKAAQNMWNTQSVSSPRSNPVVILNNDRNPEAIAKAYTADSIWRNRTSFLRGTDDIVKFLTAKWKKEKSYRLRKELFSFTDNRIAVQFWYEYQDTENGDKWTRCYGLEDWTFDKDGKMEKRMMSGNDLILGPDGDGTGRWFVDGVDVNEVGIGPEHW
jgi:nuclear transport factor 2 (NTF2) superfamily protein